ncbi:amino acid ABC transporter permease [Sodalis sp. RH21]|uniref:amino acid ABC transporter permease n=1 Tax=unclassified Sodalis (in: enterobacteria) TaxID=2636512 RepID=UPI0039B5C191
MRDFIPLPISWLPMLAYGAMTTAALCAAAIAAGFGVGVAVYRLQASRWPPCRRAAGAYISLFRGTPVLAQVLLCFYAPGELGLDLNGHIAAALALTLNTAAYQAQILRSGFMAIPPGQMEAAVVSGISPRRMLWHIQIPQVLRLVLPSLVSELIDVVKASAVVSVIAITDVMRVGQQMAAATCRPLAAYGATALAYLALTSLLSLLGRYIERRWRQDAS